MTITPLVLPHGASEYKDGESPFAYLFNDNYNALIAHANNVMIPAVDAKMPKSGGAFTGGITGTTAGFSGAVTVIDATTGQNPVAYAQFLAILDFVFPVGSFIAYGADNLPLGSYLSECDGTELLRSQYPVLFNRFGTKYGAGNGATTFNKPNFNRRSLRGRYGSNQVGMYGGSDTVNISTNNLPAHTHIVTDTGHIHAITDAGHTHSIKASGGYNYTYPPYGIQANGTLTQATEKAYTGISINGATTGISLGNTGNNSPLNVENPYANVIWAVRVQ